MRITKIIHQTISTKDHLEKVFVDNISAIRNLNPGWEHRLYDDKERADFIKEHYGADMLNRYNRINPSYGPARADLFRYLLIHKIGGVYLDLKSTTTKPLSEVLRPDDAYILSHWDRDLHKGWGNHPGLGRVEEYQQWHIVSEPRHPFLDAVIRSVVRNIDSYTTVKYGVGKRGVLLLTGPIPYTLAIESVKGFHPFRYADADELGLKYSIFESAQDKLAHERLFQGHYHTSSEPIVSPALFDAHGELTPTWKEIGRNAYCPCGSGKRYKHCHGAIS